MYKTNGLPTVEAAITPMLYRRFRTTKVRTDIPEVNKLFADYGFETDLPATKRHRIYMPLGQLIPLKDIQLDEPSTLVQQFIARYEIKGFELHTGLIQDPGAELRTAFGLKRVTSFGQLTTLILDWFKKRPSMLEHPDLNWDTGQPGSKLSRSVVQQVYRDFEKDPQRQGNSVLRQGYVVISRHPYDLMGMSFERGWTSCMELTDGSNASFISEDIVHGTIICYLLKQLPSSGASRGRPIVGPVARILIKPYETDSSIQIGSRTETKRVVGWVQEPMYGAQVPMFERAVNRVVDQLNKGKPSGVYRKPTTLYTDLPSAMPINVTDIDELSNFVSSNESVGGFRLYLINIDSELRNQLFERELANVEKSIASNPLWPLDSWINRRGIIELMNSKVYSKLINLIVNCTHPPQILSKEVPSLALIDHPRTDSTLRNQLIQKWKELVVDPDNTLQVLPKNLGPEEAKLRDQFIDTKINEQWLISGEFNRQIATQPAFLDRLYPFLLKNAEKWLALDTGQKDKIVNSLRQILEDVPVTRLTTEEINLLKLVPRRPVSGQILRSMIEECRPIADKMLESASDLSSEKIDRYWHLSDICMAFQLPHDLVKETIEAFPLRLLIRWYLHRTIEALPYSEASALCARSIQFGHINGMDMSRMRRPAAVFLNELFKWTDSNGQQPYQKLAIRLATKNLNYSSLRQLSKPLRERLSLRRIAFRRSSAFETPLSLSDLTIKFVAQHPNAITLAGPNLYDFLQEPSVKASIMALSPKEQERIFNRLWSKDLRIEPMSKILPVVKTLLSNVPDHELFTKGFKIYPAYKEIVIIPEIYVPTVTSNPWLLHVIHYDAIQHPGKLPDSRHQRIQYKILLGPNGSTLIRQGFELLRETKLGHDSRGAIFFLHLVASTQFNHRRLMYLAHYFAETRQNNFEALNVLKLMLDVRFEKEGGISTLAEPPYSTFKKFKNLSAIILVNEILKHSAYHPDGLQIRQILGIKQTSMWFKLVLASLNLQAITDVLHARMPSDESTIAFVDQSLSTFHHGGPLQILKDIVEQRIAPKNGLVHFLLSYDRLTSEPAGKLLHALLTLAHKKGLLKPVMQKLGLFLAIFPPQLLTELDIDIDTF